MKAVWNFDGKKCVLNRSKNCKIAFIEMQNIYAKSIYGLDAEHTSKERIDYQLSKLKHNELSYEELDDLVKIYREVRWEEKI